MDPTLKMAEGESLPQFDFPVDYIVYDNIRADLLKFYASFPCKILAGIFCYVEKGHISAKINLWDYDVKEHDLVLIVPGSFIQIKEVSDDVKISFQGYSSMFLHKVNYWRKLESFYFDVFRLPIFTLSTELGNVVRDELSTFTQANMLGLLETQDTIHSTFSMMLEVVDLAVKNNLAREPKTTSSREQQIVTEFIRLAFQNYREEHKVSFYAHEVDLTLSHFCNVVSRTLGMTPQELIMNFIIMDAKSQLKGTRLSVARIAQLLGFTAPTTFNRYFRTYTGMTPQEYRNK